MKIMIKSLIRLKSFSFQACVLSSKCRKIFQIYNLCSYGNFDWDWLKEKRSPVSEILVSNLDFSYNFKNVTIPIRKLSIETPVCLSGWATLPFQILTYWTYWSRCTWSTQHCGQLGSRWRYAYWWYGSIGPLFLIEWMFSQENVIRTAPNNSHVNYSRAGPLRWECLELNGSFIFSTILNRTVNLLPFHSSLCFLKTA